MIRVACKASELKTRVAEQLALVRDLQADIRTAQELPTDDQLFEAHKGLHLLIWGERR